jgi:hypothetical protein
VLVRVDEDVLAAPDDAISTLAGVSTVYVIENGTARQQQVTLGAHQEGATEILDGLKGNEILATTNINQLATGTSVRTGSDEGARRGGSGFGRRSNGSAGERRGGREGAD